MTQDNQHHRFGYKPFDDGAYARPSYEQVHANQGYDRSYERSRRSVIASPGFKLAAFVVAVVVFGSVVYFSASNSDNNEPVPVVKAEAGPVKTRPSDPGGMEIPNRDSTIFDALNEQASARPQRRIENLLDDRALEEQPVDRGLVLRDPEPEDAGEETFVVPSRIPAGQIDLTERPAVPKREEVAKAESEASREPKAEELAEATPPAETPKAEQAKAEPKTKAPDTLHKPGASPDTLAFVRSVLDKKDGKAADVANIEPAAGTPGPAVAPKSGAGSYYVQLASVTSASAAASSWGKFKEQFANVLGNSEYRVQKADLGAKGTYYRIQAGPFAEADAKSICDSIKAQKPGGCLVVK